MRKSLLYILIFIFAGLSACMERRTTAADNVIASVSGESLTLGEAMEQIPPFLLQQDTLSAVHSYANQWMQKRIAVDHAERIGIQNTPDFQEKLNRYRDQLLENLLKEYILSEHQDEIEVSIEEAQNYYQSHREQFIFDERYVRFRHLTTQTRADAENANRDIMNGVEWTEVIENYSIDPEYQLRQSTQFWPVSMALADIPVLNQNLRRLGITERSPIHFIRGQFHLLQLMEERTEGEYPDLEWLIPQIQEWLKLENARRITNAYLRNLYLQAEANNEIEQLNVSDIEELLTQ